MIDPDLMFDLCLDEFQDAAGALPESDFIAPEPDKSTGVPYAHSSNRGIAGASSRGPRSVRARATRSSFVRIAVRRNISRVCARATKGQDQETLLPGGGSPDFSTAPGNSALIVNGRNLRAA